LPVDASTCVTVVSDVRTKTLFPDAVMPGSRIPWFGLIAIGSRVAVLVCSSMV
jgi:hypothetical protein